MKNKKKPTQKDLRSKTLERAADKMLKQDAKQQALKQYTIDPNAFKDIFSKTK